LAFWGPTGRCGRCGRLGDPGLGEVEQLEDDSLDSYYIARRRTPAF
jgi:hypothetical protein